jgi:hypothetical protein
MLLWEGDADAAWQATVQGGCHRQLWLILARGRTAQHPADVLPVLQHEVLDTIDGANRNAYPHAARLAVALGAHAAAADESAAIDTWISQVRTNNKRRRALQEEFTTARLPERVRVGPDHR